MLGTKRDQKNVTLDGVDVNDNQGTGLTATTSAGLNAALPIPLDSVQEFRVTIAGQGADQGRSAGGQVALVTKSGSNQWHGSLYEFHRNVKTATNDWFSNRSGLKREALIRNQYGASLGGRLIRDRAFFFVNWEDRKDRSASAQSRNVPTETLKQGIVQFRQTNGQIGQLTPAEVMAVDPRREGYSAAMKAILASYPVANDLQAGSDRGLNFGVFRFNAPLTRNDRAYVSKWISTSIKWRGIRQYARRSAGTVPGAGRRGEGARQFQRSVRSLHGRLDAHTGQRFQLWLHAPGHCAVRRRRPKY